MTQSVIVLGRQPALGLAELEALFGAEVVKPIGQIALLDISAEKIPFERLGGAIKAAKVLDILPFTDWQKITRYLVEHVPKHTCCFEAGKLTFGISTYGLKASPQSINATALAVKKAVRATGRPVRVVPNKGTELNSAQVLHNRMTDLPLGMELLLIADRNQTILAQTVAVQDIEAYGARDQARPYRDARVGMLPPKLAQIIINLAGGKETPDGSLTLLDPFCGTGVVLQEALLMDYSVYGTDLDPRMMEYTQQNLAWLNTTHKLDVANGMMDFEVADATNHIWHAARFHLIAAETYLGRPFSAPPHPEILHEVMRDVDTIHRKFLQNVARQTARGFRMCIAVPAWATKNGFKHLPTLDSLKDLGYTRINFVHAPREELIYHRPGQIVGRELVVLERK